MIPKRNLKRAIKKSIKQPGYALSNLSKRIKASVYYKYGNGKSSWPETISIFITYKCNLNCKMCGQWGDQGTFKYYDKTTLQHQLSLESIKKLVEDVKFFNPNITLFGGEPLINPDIIKIIKVIKKNGLRCNLITNGTLMEKYAQDLVKSGLDEIIFSLDGDEKTHDSIRGIPGTFQRALKGFQKLDQLKKQTEQKKPLVNINSTIFEDNHQFFNATIAEARKFNPDNLTFHHLLFLNADDVNTFQRFFNHKFGQPPFDWQGFATNTLPDINPDKIISQITSINQQKYPFSISFFPNFNNNDIKKWYNNFSFKSSSYKNRCLSLWLTAYIFPDGNVRPYHTMNYNLGNIHDQSFTAIWNNDKFRKLRQYIIKHKFFTICSKGCTEFFRY